MHVIVWKFEVPPEHAAEFCATYSNTGDWAMLFAQAPGYLGTELLQCADKPNWFLTLDRWRCPEDFRDFQQRFHQEYSALDARCAALTSCEHSMGAFDTLPCPIGCPR